MSMTDGGTGVGGTRNASMELRGVSVSIRGTTILDDASLDLPSGQVTGIIGPNGAGKSTLLAVAAGQRNPTAGTVRLGGQPLQRVSAKAAARMRAVMPQDTTVAFPFTVREVVAMGRTPWDTGRERDREIVDATVELTEIQDIAGRQITTLSGGERQRVAFARIVAQATPVGLGSVLLLDEPTAAMDIAHAEATLRLVRSLAADGAAVGIVMHDLDAAASYADRIALMAAGRIVGLGAVREVCTPAALSEVYGTPIDVVNAGERVHVTPHRDA